jgi:hypothetical protein
MTKEVEEHRHIIQNQALIQLLFMLTVMSGFHIGGLTFWLVFCTCPIIVVPAILVSWIVSSIIYIALRLRVILEERKESY